MMVMMVMRAPDADAHARHHDDGPVMVMVVMAPVAMVVMMMVAIAGDLHLAGLICDIVLASRTRGRISRPQSCQGVRNRIEQLGKRLCALRLGWRGGRSGLRGCVECRQSGDGADGADEFLVHENVSLWFDPISQRTRRPSDAPAPHREPASRN
jgi:hypothetical protein